VKIATWNVNSIRARAERLAAWLARVRPDVVCLQELKVVEADFPQGLVEQAGYRAAVFGQKTYNGVAILSLEEPCDVRRGMEGEPADAEARLLSARVGPLRVVSVYVPNGQEVGSEKWAYKLDWMRRLGEHLERTCRSDEPLVVCGDLNVARDDLDVARPQEWAQSVLCHPDARAAFERWCAWGLADVFRRHHPEGGLYSWWDYRMLAFPKNDGLRLDYVLATEPLAGRCTSAEIDRQERKGPKPSDHAPVVAEFADDGY
jgi:exodeoxyribonuclease III